MKIVPAAVAFALLSALSPAYAQAQTGITEQEAHAIGVNAYLYFYPLLSLDLTRRQSTNIEPGKEVGKGPMNAFSSFPAFPSADNKLVVRFNFDTLYSPAWLDLTKEPVVVSAPDTNGRYYLSANARYVDRCICLARLAHDGDSGGKFSHHSARLERSRSFGNDADQRADALCLDHSDEQRPTVRRTTMRSIKFRPVTRSHRFRSGVSHPFRQR